MKLKEVIQRYLTEKGMSAREFGRRCGFSNAYITILLKGVNPRSGDELNPTLDTYQKVARGMGISLGELLNETGYVSRLSVYGTERYNPFYDRDNDAYGTDDEWRKRHGAIDENPRLQRRVDALRGCDDSTLDKVLAVIEVMTK